ALRRPAARHQQAPRHNDGLPFARSSTSSHFLDVARNQARIVLRPHVALEHFFGQAHALFSGEPLQVLLCRADGMLDISLTLSSQIRNFFFISFLISSPSSRHFAL